MVEAKLQSLVERLEKAVERSEALAAGGGSRGATKAGEVPKLAKEYAESVTPKIEALQAKC